MDSTRRPIFGEIALALGLTILVLGPAPAPAISSSEEVPAAPSGLPLAVVEVESSGGEWLPVRTELATTYRSRAMGLMFREELPDGEGMLFVFEDESIRAFWMRDTLVSLDMIFIGEDGTIVGVVHEAEPLTSTPRMVDSPSRYVLEVRGGWAREHGVARGSRARFRGVPGIAGAFGEPASIETAPKEGHLDAAEGAGPERGDVDGGSRVDGAGEAPLSGETAAPQSPIR